MSNPPGIEKDNAFTRLAREVAAVNATRGYRGGQYITAEPPTSVQSAAMLEKAPAVMPQEEIDRLNKLAGKAGVPGFEDFTGSEEVFISHGDVRGVAVEQRKSFMPDFSKVERIDLVNDVVIVDGMEFKFPAIAKANLVKFCIDTVLTSVTELLAKAGVKYNLFDESSGKGKKKRSAKKTRKKSNRPSRVAVQTSDGVKQESK